MTKFHTSTLAEYTAWLTAWLEGEAVPTHYYDYPFARQTWLTAQQDFTTGGECGSHSANIIIPEGVRHTGGNLGHNQLYWLDGPARSGHVVPVFDEPPLLALPGIAAFVEAKEQAGREEWRRRQADDQRGLLARQKSDLSRYFDPTTEEGNDQAQ